MTRNIRCWLFVIFLCSISASIEAEPFTLEGKAGVFIPSSKKMRQIFSGCMPFIELEGGYRFCCNWGAWAGVGYIFAEGESISCGTSTTIDVVPITLGIKRYFTLTRNFEGFLGLGALWSQYNNKDHSQAVHQRNSANAFGGVARGGIQWQWRCHTFISLFGEYVYQRFNFSRVYQEHFTYRHDVDMSGVKFGVGVAYGF